MPDPTARRVVRDIIGGWRSAWRAVTWALVGSRPGVEYEMARLRRTDRVRH